jgi:DNA polymerase alpha subunit A
MLSKRVGNYVLDQVMSGKPKEEIQLALNDFLSDIGQKLKNNQLNISEYIITKQLTKMPE